MKRTGFTVAILTLATTITTAAEVSAQELPSRTGKPVTGNWRPATGNWRPATGNCLQHIDVERHHHGPPMQYELGVLAVDDREVVGERLHVRAALRRDLDLQEVLILDACVLRVERGMRAIKNNCPHRRAGFRPDGV